MHFQSCLYTSCLGALIDFVANYLDAMGKRNPDMPAMIRLLQNDKFAKDMASREIKDLKGRHHRPDGSKRDYKINGLVKSAKDEKVNLTESNQV
jgi:hypothetical protein